MPIVLLLAAIAALAFLSEGEMGNWVTIYLRSVLELPVLVGSSGFVVFHSAMFVGRLLGARATRRAGPWLVLQIAGTTVTGGMLLALASERVPLILLSFLFVGLGLSVVAPTAYSLVGDAAVEQAGAASSVLTTVGYGGYLFGPVLVGDCRVCRLTSCARHHHRRWRGDRVVEQPGEATGGKNSSPSPAGWRGVTRS